MEIQQRLLIAITNMEQPVPSTMRFRSAPAEVEMQQQMNDVLQKHQERCKRFQSLYVFQREEAPFGVPLQSTGIPSAFSAGDRDMRVCADNLPLQRIASVRMSPEPLDAEIVCAPASGEQID